MFQIIKKIFGFEVLITSNLYSNCNVVALFEIAKYH